MAIAGYKAIVKEQSSAIGFTAEATTTTDDTTYQITNTSKRIFAYTIPLVVKDGGVETTEDYTLNRLNGSVTFDSVDAGRVITFDGSYVTLTTVVQAREFSFEGSTDLADSTIFQDTDRTYIPTLAGATINISKFYSDDNYFLDMLFNKTVKVIEFKPNSVDDGVFRVFGNVSSDGVVSEIGSLVGESISIQCTDEMISEA